MSVLRRLYHCAEDIVTDETEILYEKKYIKEVLHNCGYPNWFFNKVLQKQKSLETPKPRKNNDSKCSITVLCMKSLSAEAYRSIASEFGIRTQLKPTITEVSLGQPRKLQKENLTCGAVYYICCSGDGALALKHM